MNILIVGNGFDLSHYLPTKYDHFMDVMEAIEKSKNESMNFDELFSTCREEWFIAETKQYYLTENIVLEKEQLENMRGLLKENCWYQYFKNHVKEVTTWIDFEQKIEDVLISFKIVNQEITAIKNSNSETFFTYLNAKEDIAEVTISHKNKMLLNFFKFTDDERYQLRSFQAGIPASYGVRKNLNSIFCYGGKFQNGFNPKTFLDYIHNELEDFIKLFNLYLDYIISQLRCISTFAIRSSSWIQPDKIFSFNYTNTYQRIYDLVEVDYLHGSHGEFQNIVLGISDIEDESLKKLKAYGFTKYHQKLFKDTNYEFLDKYINQIKKTKFHTDKNLKLMQANAFGDIRSKVMKRMLTTDTVDLDLTFYIWGHSLDVSDRDYIIDLFSLNDDIDRNVRVVVFYFDKPAKFSLLNNLLAILDKDKVEQWMKNKWLTF